MKVILAKDYEQMCSFSGRFVTKRIREKPDLVLGLATGRTMVGFYANLAERYRAQECSFARVTTFNLDEYVGLPEDHEASYHAYMKRHFVDKTDVRPEAVHIPDGNASDLLAAAADYEAAIKVCGGIEIQVLGIGVNGHVAFNEPGSSLASRTRVKRLSEETILANAPEFGGPEHVPRYVITMGIGTIMEARFILLLASGQTKAMAIRNMVEGSICSWWPASILQMHPHAFVIVDRDAASLLTHRHDTVEEVISDPYEEFFFEGELATTISEG